MKILKKTWRRNVSAGREAIQAIQGAVGDMVASPSMAKRPLFTVLLIRFFMDIFLIVVKSIIYAAIVFASIRSIWNALLGRKTADDATARKK